MGDEVSGLFSSLWNSDTSMFNTILLVIFMLYFLQQHKDLKKKLTNLWNVIQNIKDQLLFGNYIKPAGFWFQSESPMKITQEGNEILKKYKVDQFIEKLEPKLDEYRRYKTKESKLFMELMKFVKEDKQLQEKVYEIIYNTNQPKDLCEKLLALAIRDKIIK